MGSNPLILMDSIITFLQLSASVIVTMDSAPDAMVHMASVVFFSENSDDKGPFISLLHFVICVSYA